MKSTVQIIFLSIFLIGAFYIGEYYGRSNNQKQCQITLKEQVQRFDSLQVVSKQQQVHAKQDVKVLKDSIQVLHEEIEGFVHRKR